VLCGRSPTAWFFARLEELILAVLKTRLERNMNLANVQFAGSVPALYDRHLGPVLFEPYAIDLARRAGSLAKGRVLEIACGTGVLTRHLRHQLPASVHLTATDLNQGMIDYARKKLPELISVEWQQADAAALPFPSSNFGAVVCQFGFMFLPDKKAAFQEARRVLAPDGYLVFSVWDNLAENVFAQIAHQTIGSFFPSDPPSFFEIPYGFYDAAVIQEMLHSIGFVDVAIARRKLEASSPTAESLAIGLVTGTPVSAAIRERGASMESIVSAVAAKLADAGGEHPFRMPMQALIVTARAN
jgi:SAM-dependent methyltransferase